MIREGYDDATIGVCRSNPLRKDLPYIRISQQVLLETAGAREVIAFAAKYPANVAKEIGNELIRLANEIQSTEDLYYLEEQAVDEEQVGE